MLHVSHNVTNYEFFYEPFYVSLDSVPRYDERFVGYGFTRNTQVNTERIFIRAFNDPSRNTTSSRSNGRCFRTCPKDVLLLMPS